ncbi:hypothetical protein, conserved [Eimeria praecox]|uniref:Uncharacterized protein n=1 Tax=Eimeria praecox TaxID=51316 RepID=U6GNL4_9EIME|nr:hypothetical protein, conserved [Eimeria praecox]
MSVLLSLCGRTRKVNEAATVRRLAAGGEGHGFPSGQNPLFDGSDWIPLDADELALLCIQMDEQNARNDDISRASQAVPEVTSISAAQEWMPSTAPPSISSASPAVPEVTSSFAVQRQDISVEPLQQPNGSHMILSRLQLAQESAFGVSGAQRPLQSDPDEAVAGPSWKAVGCVGSASVGRAVAFHRSVLQSRPETVLPVLDVVLDTAFQRGVMPLPSLVDPPEPTAQSVLGHTAQQKQPSPNPSQGLQRHHSSGQVAQGGTQGLPGELPQSVDEVSTHSEVLGPLARTTEAGGPPVDSGVVHERGAVSQGTWQDSSQQVKLMLKQKLLAKQLSSSETSCSKLPRSSLPAEEVSQMACEPVDHPFTRLPKLDPDVRLQDITVRALEEWDKHEPLILHLKVIRSLSLQASMSLSDAKEMVDAAQRLASRALFSMAAPVDRLRPSAAVESLGRRFLAFNAFYGVLHVMRGMPELRKSWESMVASVPTTYAHRPRGAVDGKYGFYYRLARQMSEALELYKRGGAPTDKEVIEIKRKLFCMECSPRCFLGSSWAVWRGDDQASKSAH